MKGVQLWPVISADVMDRLKAAAEKKGLTPNILVRIMLHEHFGQPDTESKSYTFTSKNWREIEAYVEVKCLGSVESFTTRSLEDVMSKNRLTAAQKAKYDRLLGNGN
jgi:hypothetical protein